MANAIIVAGLMFGDEGKGSIVDALVRQTGAKLVVRYNGGPQAAHHVMTEGQTHRFSMFGSGTLAGASTYLSRFVAIDPILISHEATRLQTLGLKDIWRTLTVDPLCPVITPYHRALNRLREFSRGPVRAHGSCGVGYGELMADVAAGRTVIRALDLRAPKTLGEKMDVIRREKLQEAQALQTGEDDGGMSQITRESVAHRYIEEAAPLTINGFPYADGPVVFEGAQGALLDEWQGFHPHTTWSDCTYRNALKVVEMMGASTPVTTVGVIRAFATRHGNGPFPTENNDLWALLRNDHNSRSIWQGPLRVGAFDLVLLRYALGIMGQQTDMIALTCLDRIHALPRWQAAARYQLPATRGTIDTLPAFPREEASLSAMEQLGQLIARSAPIYEVADNPVDYIQAATQVPVGIVSRGPAASQKTFRPVYHWHATRESVHV